MRKLDRGEGKGSKKRKVKIVKKMHNDRVYGEKHSGRHHISS